MDRRTFLAAGASAAAFIAAPRAASQQSPLLAPDRAAADDIIRSLPFRVVSVPGQRTLATLNSLRGQRGSSPVILGGDDDVFTLQDAMSLAADKGESTRPIQILKRAGALSHPRDLQLRAAEDRRKAAAYVAGSVRSMPDSDLPKMEAGGRQLTPAEIRARMEADLLSDPVSPAIGEWPRRGQRVELLAMLHTYRTTNLPERVHIAVVPANDWTEIPAWLNFGGWNACPAPEYHVAAFRSWRDRYGAELVVMAGAVVELRISRRPKTREEALALARELYVYNSDLIEQGFGDLAPLAASLMASDVWAFWWD